MCCCAKPNINGEFGYSWNGPHVGVYPLNPPALGERDTLLFDEPGRCGGLDCHSHHFRLVKNCGTVLLVRHGGGDERIYVSLPKGFSFDGMDSNTRYFLFHAIYYAHHTGEQEGREATTRKYNSAFVDGRLKKRKLPARGVVKVWIEPKVTPAPTVCPDCANGTHEISGNPACACVCHGNGAAA